MIMKGASTSVIVVAAGRGTRMGETTLPKQYMDIGGKPLLAHTLLALLAYPDFKHIVCVIHPDDTALYDACILHIPDDLSAKLMPPVMGGATRQESVYRGLQAMQADPPAYVLIHDGARPKVSVALIERIRAALHAKTTCDGVIPVLAITDTLKRIDAEGHINATVPRETIVSVQTPQGFRFDAILNAHHHAYTQNQCNFTDDGAVMEHYHAGNGCITTVLKTVIGEKDNIKVTTPHDLLNLSPLPHGAHSAIYPRVGMGYDVHAFGSGDHVWLGGVKIAHSHGVIAHSDGDVVLHALTDALLGTIANGDIGTHFPPSDPQWRGASSDQFLAHACNLVRDAGGIIAHMDITVICEKPKIGVHREAMVQRISEIANIPIKSISVKATTSEKLGFTGRGEGLAAHAIVTVYFP